ncbi:hypothetical protein KDH_77070 [Dictyobacter sp. S3.2.2.5]|uniref:Uncharacterized protein n=1 Tax=Dictyobacter halimunensis TaxID=3026934 RepID=A0ABQ6G4W9_9CHLR|nr:hypothetical protein KDH_77070 [Dictyobacter sp. S3.2.2.5]
MERLLTTEEIFTLAREHKVLARWKKIQRLATDICGDRAHKVIISIEIRNATDTFPGTHFVAIYDKKDQFVWGDGVFPNANNAKEIFHHRNFNIIPYDEKYDFARDKDALFAQFPPFDEMYQKQSPLTSFCATDLAEYGTDSVDKLDQAPSLSFPDAYIKEGDSYQHILKPAEVMHLAEMHHEYHNWDKVRKIVRDAYGPQASLAIVQSYPMYNDDGGYYSLPEFREIQDKHGNTLQPNPTLPAWQNGDILKAAFPYDPDEFMLYTIKGEEYNWNNVDFPTFVGNLSEWELRSNVDTLLEHAGIFTSHTYNLDLPPAVPPEVYISSH